MSKRFENLTKESEVTQTNDIKCWIDELIIINPTFLIVIMNSDNEFIIINPTFYVNPSFYRIGNEDERR